MGFHASVRRPGGPGPGTSTPPTTGGARPGTLSYYGAAVPAVGRDFVERDAGDTAEAIAAATRADRPRRTARSCRRTYRLAFVTDPSYATYFGAANVLGGEDHADQPGQPGLQDDLAIQFVLVADNDLLNLNTAAEATDRRRPVRRQRLLHRRPSSPTAARGDLLDRNEFVIGQIIGADNYDIGHIGLGVNGGGVAGLGVVGGSEQGRGAAPACRSRRATSTPSTTSPTRSATRWAATTPSTAPSSTAAPPQPQHRHHPGRARLRAPR